MSEKRLVVMVKQGRCVQERVPHVYNSVLQRHVNCDKRTLKEVGAFKN